MSYQHKIPPDDFSAEDLEETVKKAWNVARRVNADQRWHLAEVIKQFAASRYTHERSVRSEADKMQAGVKPFRLMDLPPELRNRIYAYCVKSEKPFVICASIDPSFQPPITKICRQTRQEALPLFYLLNAFYSHVYRCDFRLFIQYAETIEAGGILRIGTIHFEIRLPDRGKMHCGVGLEQLVQWYATKDLHIIEQWTWGGNLTVDVSNHIYDAVTLSMEYYNKHEDEDRSDGAGIAREVSQLFQEWLVAKELKCCGEACTEDEDGEGWCSKLVQDRKEVGDCELCADA